ncbi:MAG: hypothetical protein LUH40_09135 [Clostridiales bacterium]|nr:hypothetical protein [Clostridiales bacterium]
MKKLLSVVLSLVMIASCAGITAFADSDSDGTSYPYVFVHGMMGWGSYDGINDLVPYWGGTNGDMLEDLQAMGIECYAASVGKISSNWDRACELYAQLTGTVVDYGEAHSAAHGHARYGRSYEGNALMDTFGQTDENGELIKINLIGHSLGGPTVRLFTWLLENGSEEEQAASGDDVSDFFTGGKGDYVYSVTTMSAPHNGTPASNILYDELPTAYMLALMGNVLGTTALSSVWDFQLEQYGLTTVSSQGIKGKLSFSGIKSLVTSDDNCGYDLTIRGAAALNEMIDTVDGVYYFSYTGQQVSENSDGTYSPPITMFPLFTLLSYKIGHFDGEVYDGVEMTAEWRENDGIVPVISALYPFDEEYVYYEDISEDEIQTGVWNVMPVIENFSHVGYMGMDTSDFEYIYVNQIELINSL